MTPNFSIIIPTYNHLALAQRAIESVRSQEGVSMEIIVCDDSTDNRIQQYVMGLHDDRINYRHNRPQLGAVDNWNAGLGKATGTYGIVLHHDEALIGNDYLAQLLHVMQQTNADIAVSEVRVMIGERQKKRYFPPRLKRWMLHHPTTLFGLNAIGPCACIAFRCDKRQAFHEPLQWLVDVEWYYRMLHASRIVYCPTIIVESAHNHEGQISRSIHINQAWQHDAKIIGTMHKGISLRLMLAIGKTIMAVKQQFGR